jgi:hypothetical protein
MHLKIAFAALATAGAILAVTPNAASAASIGTGALAAHEKMDNSLVEKVHRRWRYGRAYRPYYYGGYGYGYPSYGYYRPYYRPYYYGGYGYPYYSYYRPYYGPRFYGYGPRFGFSIGF